MKCVGDMIMWSEVKKKKTKKKKRGVMSNKRDEVRVLTYFEEEGRAEEK